MKRVYFICLMVIFSTFISCKKNSEKPDPIPYGYRINLKIIDDKGNDLLSSISEEDLKKAVSVKGVDGNLIGPSLNILKIYDSDYLRIESSSRSDEVLNEILYNLTFNNSNVEVFTKWMSKNKIAYINSLFVNNQKIEHKVLNTPNPFYYYELVFDE